MLNLKAMQITDKVWWVGALDWNLRDFHGYTTNRGTTYNAYLVMGDEPVLVDTVKAQFADEMLARIASIIDPTKIKTVISNHAELDHSGSLPAVMAAIKPDRVLCSVMGEAALKAQLPGDLKLHPVKDGETMDIAGSKFTFLESRMLHWPDSMVSFFHNDGVLFSNDIFGMHLAHSKRFDDETPDWFYEAATYYANIITPYSNIVTAFLAKFKAKNLPVKLIAPDHGPIWRKDIEKIISLYAKWAELKPYNKGVIVYDTMWESTALLAGAIADGLIEGGSVARVMPLKVSHRSEVAYELLEAGALFIGGPTLNRQIFPPVADVTMYLKGLNRKNLVGAAFGSYGWTPNGPNWLETQMKEMGVRLTGATVKCKYAPTAADLEAARKLGLATAAQLKQYDR